MTKRERAIFYWPDGSWSDDGPELPMLEAERGRIRGVMMVEAWRINVEIAALVREQVGMCFRKAA